MKLFFLILFFEPLKNSQSSSSSSFELCNQLSASADRISPRFSSFCNSKKQKEEEEEAFEYENLFRLEERAEWAPLFASVYFD